jgi:hypothetical protein
MFADDLILMSQSPSGLQACLVIIAQNGILPLTPVKQKS